MNAPETFADALAQWPQIQQDIAFARALRRIEFITAQGTRLPIQWRPGCENAVVDLRGLLPSGETEQAAFVSGGATLFTEVTRTGSAQTINNTTHTAIIFDGQTQGAGTGVWDGSSKMVVPAGKGGIWLFYAHASLSGGGSGNDFYHYLRVNGTAYQRVSNAPIAAQTNAYSERSICSALRLVAGDYVESVAYQSTGSAKNIVADQFPIFSACRIGD